MSKLRIFEAFSGYGSQSMALRRLGIDFEVVGISEIDEYAIQAYMTIHGDTSNYGDISKIDWSEVPDFDFLTYSFPCTDISNAGQQKGIEEGSGTRSSLLWECKKAIEAKKPKYLMMENVKALTSRKFMPYLKSWLSYLDKLGYSNFTQILNAKDYGIPQNRERVFVISILGDESYEFPKPFELEKRLKDILEDNIDEKYYLSPKVIDSFTKSNEFHTNSYRDKNVIMRYGNSRVQSLVDSGKIKGNEIQFLDAYNQAVSDISGTIKTTIDSSCLSFITEPLTCAMRGRNVVNPSDISAGISMEQRVEVGRNIANCLTTIQKDSLVIEPNAFTSNGKSDNITIPKKDNYPLEHKIVGSFTEYRIRKLTPRECFRLMGVSDEDIDKIQSAGISSAQQYKMAGNSIVVDVLYHIFRKMFIDKKQENQQLALF